MPAADRNKILTTRVSPPECLGKVHRHTISRTPLPLPLLSTVAPYLYIVLVVNNPKPLFALHFPQLIVLCPLF
jgi:hypothetical protein